MAYDDTVTGKLKRVGLGIGTGTYAQYPAATFTRGLYVQTFDCDPLQDIKPIEELRGTLPPQRRTRSVLDFKPKMEFALDCGDAYGAGFGDMMGALLGTDTATIVSPGVFKHILTVADTVEPPYLNLWTDKDPVTKQYVGFRPGSIKIGLVAKDGEAKVTIDGILQKTIDGYGTETLVYTNEQVLTGHDATIVKLGGATVDLPEGFQKIDLEVKRGQSPQHLIGADRNIGRLISGTDFELKVSGDAIVFSDETEKNKFIANSAGQFQIKLVSPSSAYIDFDFGTMAYTKFAGPALKAGDVLTQSFDAFVYGLTSTFKITIQNGYGFNYCTGAAVV